jgi:hypothetical protein
VVSIDQSNAREKKTPSLFGRTRGDPTIPASPIPTAEQFPTPSVLPRRPFTSPFSSPPPHSKASPVIGVAGSPAYLPIR